jgi:tungstate transport system substrate-binding protein
MADPGPVESGLLESLLGPYRRETGRGVAVTPRGTGAAVVAAREGRADLVLVNDLESESLLVHERFGRNRRSIFAGWFVLAGPADDPAGVSRQEAAPATGSEGGSCAVCGKGLPKGPSIVGAFRRIAAGRHPFVSVGDQSGLHLREQKIWEATGLDLPPPRYLVSGKGVRDALALAEREGAYLLLDEATLLSATGTRLAPLFRNREKLLADIYSVIPVNPARVPGAGGEAADHLAGWLASPEAQALIGAYSLRGESPYLPAVPPPP